MTTRVPSSPATGWPSIADASSFTGVGENDATLIVALDRAVAYGKDVLGEAYTGEITKSVFGACLDYAGSVYTERIGGSDIIIEGLQGSVAISRYRRALLSSRFVAIA